MSTADPMPSKMEAEEFLELVWGERPAWVDLPAKVGSYWVPWHYNYDGETDIAITRRIDTCLRDGESLYFSVAQFAERGRNIDDVLPTDWLWADLDEVHPSYAAKSELLPSIAWESSPGRYQALWRLNRELRPKTQTRINQALSYFLGADHGGWDLTQVLRLPGTRNFKYPEAPEVKLLWAHTDLVYDHKYVWRIVRASLPVESSEARDGVRDGRITTRAMPVRVRALLRVGPDDVVEGERSSKLWLIECLLSEAGWGEDQIYEVVSGSAWNKWSSVGTGERRLRAEIRKAIHHVARKKALKARDLAQKKGPTSPPTAEPPQEEEDESTSITLPFIRYSSFMAMQMEEPRWLVRDIWTAHSHGIFGGEPKTSKSTLSLALALSVASGKPFLGKYSVATPGPVLYVQEENAQWSVQDLLRKLSYYYGLITDKEIIEHRAPKGSLGKKVIDLEFPTEAPLRLLNNFGFDLTDEDHRDALWQEVSIIKPVLVVLDPLYLVLPGVDTDKAREVTPYLKWVLALRNEFGSAVMINHHFRKQSLNGLHVRAGQRLMGSTLFHGWVDSALYAEQLDPKKPGWTGARVEREFRSMAPQKALEVELFLGPPGALGMLANVKTFDVQALLERLVAEEPGITVNQLSEVMNLDRRTVLGRARDSTAVEVRGGKKGGRGKSYQLYPRTGDETPTSASNGVGVGDASGPANRR